LTFSEDVKDVLWAAVAVDFLILAALPFLGWLVRVFQPHTSRPDDWDASPDGFKWNLEAESARREQPTRVRDAAKAWGETIAVLLGIFGTVAFIKGPESLDKVPGDDAYAVAGLIIAAGAGAIISVYLAAIAAQGRPRQLENLDGWRLRESTISGAKGAAQFLAWSRRFVLAAVATLFLAMLAAWLSTLAKREPAAGQAVVVMSREGPECGTLTRVDDQLALKVGEADPVPLSDVTIVQTVDECP
jgi:hypothetical protein